MNKNRFEAFSDGVFAIAITLLILEIHVPEPQSGVPGGGLTQSLLSLWPLYLSYAACFATIGIMWMNHHALFHDVESVTHAILLVNLLLLLLVAFLPFPLDVVSRYGITTETMRFLGLLFLLISIVYGVLYYISSPAIPRPHTLRGYLTAWTGWNSVGPIGYLVAIAVAPLAPAVSLLLYALIAAYYATPILRGRLTRGATTGR